MFQYLTCNSTVSFSILPAILVGSRNEKKVPSIAPRRDRHKNPVLLGVLVWRLPKSPPIEDYSKPVEADCPDFYENGQDRRRVHLSLQSPGEQTKACSL